MIAERLAEDLRHRQVRLHRAGHRLPQEARVVAMGHRREAPGGERRPVARERGSHRGAGRGVALLEPGRQGVAVLRREAPAAGPFPGGEQRDAEADELAVRHRAGFALRGRLGEAREQRRGPVRADRLGEEGLVAAHDGEMGGDVLQPVEKRRRVLERAGLLPVPRQGLAHEAQEARDPAQRAAGPAHPLGEGRGGFSQRVQRIAELGLGDAAETGLEAGVVTPEAVGHGVAGSRIASIILYKVADRQGLFIRSRRWAPRARPANRSRRVLTGPWASRRKPAAHRGRPGIRAGCGGRP